MKRKQPDFPTVPNRGNAPAPVVPNRVAPNPIPPPPPAPHVPAPPVAPVGLLNVHSQNMQGGSNVGYVTGQIVRSHITALQESGDFAVRRASAGGAPLTPVPGLSNVLQGTINFGTERRPSLRNVVHHQNGRCSQTLFIDNALGPTAAATIPAASVDLRPVLIADIPDINMAAGSFHSPAGNSNAAVGVLRAQVSIALHSHPNFAFFGDGNGPLGEQAIPGSVSVAIPPGGTIQSGMSYDGVVHSNTVGASNVRNIGMIGGDHTATQTTIKPP